MANTAGLPTFDGYRLGAMLNRYPTTGMKVALYLDTATVGPTTTVYTTTGEVTGTGYTAGGITVDSSTAPQITGAITYWTPAQNFVFSTVTIGPTDAALVYDTNDTNANQGVFTFGAQTLVAGTLTLTMPTDDSTSALARWTWS